MLKSRRRFLEGGHYAPIGRRVCELAAAHLTGSSSLDERCRRLVLDAGCGEGYYLGLVQSGLRAGGELNVDCIGVDSSRDACRMAAQRYRDICFVVSDLKDLIPVADQRVNLLLNIFAPRNLTEFARVLAESGLIIVVIPQPHHLQELRTSFPLLGIEPAKAERVIRGFEPLLQLVKRESVEYQLLLQGQEVVDSIDMSPSHRHLTASVPVPTGPLKVSVAVEILTFRHGA
jgi:23S rRNA (guanine745-N1)-methyltransferase